MRTHFRFLCLSLAMLCIGAVSRAQLTGPITVPNATYADLAAVITALNTQGVGSGGATINLAASNPQTAPTGGYRLGSATLNASLSAANPLVINGNSNTVTGAAGVGSNDGIFWLMGTDYVTINSLNLLDVSTTTASTSTAGNEWGYMLGKRNTASPYDGCQYVTINNCSISLNKFQSTATGIYSAHANPTSTSISTSSYAVGDANSFNKFTGNTITNVSRGIYLLGSSSGVTAYDKQNQVGGATSALGNTITVGGNTFTSTLYGVYTQNDSVITVQNNTISRDPAQTNATSYGYYATTGAGTLNCLNNKFNLTSNNTTSAVWAYYNAGHSGADQTRNINSNEVWGNNTSATSNTIGAVYESGYAVANLNINGNNVHDMDMGTATSTAAYVYVFYTASNSMKGTVSISNNRVYNLKRMGTFTWFYVTYGVQSNAQVGSTLIIDNNKIRKIATGANYLCLTYNQGNTSISSNSPPRALVRHNVFDSMDCSTAASYNYIYNQALYYNGDSSVYSYDTMTNWTGTMSTSTSAYTYFYNYFYQYYGQKGSRYSNNYINNWKGNYSYAYIYNYYIQFADSNKFENITLGLNGSPNNYIYNYLGMYGTDGFCRNNTMQNFSVASSGGIYNCLGYYGSNYEVGNNSIKNMNVVNGAMYNYIGYYPTGVRAYNNRVDSMNASGSGAIYAFYSYTNGKNDTLYNNVVSNLRSTGTGTTNAMYGYYIGAGANTTQYFYNNAMSNIEVPANFNGNNLFGIYTPGGGNYALYNNTVRINPSLTPTGASFGATGIFYAASGTLDLRNNIINLNVTPGANAVAVALRRASGTTGTVPANFLASSNSNIFWVPSNLSNAWYYAEGTNTNLSPANAYNSNAGNDVNFNTPCGLFKSFMGHNKSSFWENQLTLSGTVPNAYTAFGTSYAEKGATVVSLPLPAISSDLAGVTRGTPADIGALEFSGTALDNAPPQISYTAVPTTNYCSSAPTIVATITDQTGVNNTTNPPRLYFKKSTDANTFGGNTSATSGWKHVPPTSVSGNDYTFDFNYGLLPLPAVGGGTTIQYFIIAEDVTTNTNTNAAVAGFAVCPTTVTLTAANAPVNTAPAPNQFTILALPSTFQLPATYLSLCVSGTTTMTINPAPVGTGIQWQSSSLTGTFTNITGATGTSYTTPTLTTTTRYRAVLYCGTNVLTTTVIDTIRVNNPTMVSTTGASRCGYGPVTLTANTGGTASVNWYTSATASNPVASGLNFQTPNLSASRTYYASAVVPGGSTEIVGYNPPSFNPTPYSYTSGAYGLTFRFLDTTSFYSTDIYVQGNGTVSIDLIDIAAGASVSGFPKVITVTGTFGNYTIPTTVNLNALNLPPGDYNLVATPTVSLAYQYGLSAPTFTYPLVSNVTGRSSITGAVGLTGAYYWYFYRNVISGPCENPTRFPVVATVTPSTPITASSASGAGICSGSSAVLNVNSTNSTYLYGWTVAPTPAPIPPLTATSTGSSITVSPTSPTKYYVVGTDVLSGCTAIDSISLFVNPVQPAPSITPVNPTICEKSAVQLTASPTTPFGGQAQVGTGTLNPGGTSWPSPFGGYYEGGHEQYLVKASELTAAGMFAGTINSIEFNMLTAPNSGMARNFVMRIAHSTLTTMPTTSLVTTGFTTVANHPTLTTNVTGWVQVPFNVSTFNWDGVSNIIVDVAQVGCASCPTATCSSWTYYVGSSFNQTSYSYNASVHFQSIFNCTITSLTPSATNLYQYGTSYFTYKPNMRFNWGKPYVINWLNVSGLYKNYPPLSGPMTTADTNMKVWASPSVTTVYRAVTNAQGCISAPSNPDTVFVSPAPPTAITPAGPQTICAGSSVTLTAPSGATMVYQWYLNGSAIAAPAGTANTYAAASAGNYRVAVTNLSTGCSDTSAVTVVSTNALPTNTVTASGATTFCNGGSVTLTSASTSSPVAFQWYRNGVAITGSTLPTLTVNASGTYYSVATNANQCTQQSNSVVVTVNTTPNTVTASGSTSFCSGGSVTFSAPTTGNGAPFTYQWNNAFGLITGATNSTYTATAAGTYTVTVTSTTNGCISSSSPMVVTIGPGPSSAIVPAGAQNLCNGDTLILTTNSAPGLVYQWLRNGSTAPGMSTGATYAATLAGTYTVTVSIAGQPSCTSTTTGGTVITVNPKPTVNITTGGLTTFCSGGSVTLTANAATSTGTVTGYQWNINGAAIPGATNSTYSASTNGNYTVSATNSFGCSQTSAIQVVNVNPPPAISINSSGPTTFCAGGSTVLTSSGTFPSYVWNMNGTPIGTGGTSNSYTANATGVYTLTVTNASGCSNTSAPVSVQVNPLPVVTTTPMGNDTICSGATRVISTGNVPNQTYQWRNSAGDIAGATQHSFSATTPNTYSVRVTNTITGCSTTSAPVVIAVIPPPAATITRAGAAVICSADSTRLDANTGPSLSYQWNYNNTPIAGATGDKLWAHLQGNYTVTVKNAGGCTTTSPVTTVTVNPSPAAYITYNTPLVFCAGTAVVLNANTGTGLTYQWLLNGAPTTNTGGSYIASSSGIYALKTTNTFGCSTESDTLRVTAHPTPMPSIVRSGSTLSTATTYANYQWFFNNVAIGGANGQNFTFSQNGAYKVRVIDGNGCEGWSELLFIMNVGITPTPTSVAIKVFPNPTTGLLKIDAPVKVKLALRDVTGKVVAEASDVKEMDITEVANGMYLLYISDMNGKLLRADKVTKTAN